MKDLPEHELLSAYLDGELTAAEQARVEQFLAGNPASRHVLDALRSVSTAVQGLPELHLGEDLSDRVLRQAERAILTGPDQPSGCGSTSPPERLRWQELFRRVVTSRGVAWSGAALAIALLIMLSGTPERQRDVALAPESTTGEAAPGAMAEPRGAAEMWAADGERGASLQRDAAENALAAREEAAPREAPDRAAPRAAADAIPPREPSPDVPAAHAPEPTPPRMAPAMTLDVAERPAEAKQEELPASDPRGRAPPPREAEQVEADIPADLPVLLVHCDITPEAARVGTFDQILSDQQLALADGSARPARSERMADPQAVRRSAGELSQRVERHVDKRQDLDGESDDAFELVYLEATPGQVTATLNQLAQLPDQFLAVSIKPAPGVASQQSLTRFNRLAVPPPAEVSEEQARRLRMPARREIAKRADEPAEKPAAPLSRGGVAEPTPAPSSPDRSPIAGRGPQILDDRAGYGGAAGMRLGARPADAPHPEAGEAAPSGEHDRAAAESQMPRDELLESESAERYRVLFVLRVVPPELLAAPAAAAREPPPDAVETLPTEQTDDDGREPGPAADGTRRPEQ